MTASRLLLIHSCQDTHLGRELMKRTCVFAIGVALATLTAAEALAQAVLQPILQLNEPLIAIDIIPGSQSSYPGAENPAKAIDGVIPPSGSTTGNKYLNFGK